MRIFFAVVLGLAAGLVLGGFAGAQYYIHFGPSWGQYGYEFQGLVESAVGAVLGGLGGAGAAGFYLLRSRRPGGISTTGRRGLVTLGVAWLALYVTFVVVVFAVLTLGSSLGWHPTTSSDRFAGSLGSALLACLALWAAKSSPRSSSGSRDRASISAAGADRSSQDGRSSTARQGD